MASNTAAFSHPNYNLVNGDRVVKRAGASQPTHEEEILLNQEIAKYVESTLISCYGFVVIPIPGEDSYPSTSILASPDWMTAPNMLVIIQNSAGSYLGIFSRSLCLDQGLTKGSMLPYVDRAISLGYSVLILRPNTNSILEEVSGERPNKIMIPGSDSPEIHTLCVWENVIRKSEGVKHVSLLGYANGASLCKELLLKQMVREEENPLIQSVITIEASIIIEDDDAEDIKKYVNSMTVNMECSKAPRGYRLHYRRDKLGCACVSLGLPDMQTEILNVASSLPIAIGPVFKYLELARAGGAFTEEFVKMMSMVNGHSPETAVITVNPNADADDLVAFGTPAPPGRAATTSTDPSPSTPSAAPPLPGPALMGWKFPIYRRVSGFIASRAAGAHDEDYDYDESKLTVKDFDLLRIVGKGAFGKVLLVRKKNGIGSGQIYAMKILKKSMLMEKNQMEHAKSERDILFEIRHPFIVRLRFAFQNDEKLYLVTDYYNGGALFYHLRKANCFSENRTRFYAAELLSALDHLHQQHIIYRDLKLENVLMDHQGHVALTDFGLSKQDIDKSGGATTFCGTPDYVAPELLKGLKYGKAVDWWSFGVLLFEMMSGQTPFYDKNRKVMFNKIVQQDAVIPSSFSREARDIIRQLLQRNVTKRLGSSEAGARDIMTSPFFSIIDFDMLYRKEIAPPFRPDVVNASDTKYVPKFFLNSAAVDSVDNSSKKKRGGATPGGRGGADGGAGGAQGGKGGGDNPEFDAFTFTGDSSA